MTLPIPIGFLLHLTDIKYIAEQTAPLIKKENKIAYGEKALERVFGLSFAEWDLLISFDDLKMEMDSQLHARKIKIDFNQDIRVMLNLVTREATIRFHLKNRKGMSYHTANFVIHQCRQTLPIHKIIFAIPLVIFSELSRHCQIGLFRLLPEETRIYLYCLNRENYREFSFQFSESEILSLP